MPDARADAAVTALHIGFAAADVFAAAGLLVVTASPCVCRRRVSMQTSWSAAALVESGKFSQIPLSDSPICKH